MSFVENMDMEMFYGQSMERMPLIIPVYNREAVLDHILEGRNIKGSERESVFK